MPYRATQFVVKPGWMLTIDFESMFDFYSGILFFGEGVMFMRRAQDCFEEIGRKKMIEDYLEYASNGNDKYSDLFVYSKEQQKKRKYRELDKFIQYLIDMDVTEIENGKTYILFDNSSRLVSTDEMNDESSVDGGNVTEDFIGILNGIFALWFIAFAILSLKQIKMIFYALVVWIIMLIFNIIWYIIKRKAEGKKDKTV